MYFFNIYIYISRNVQLFKRNLQTNNKSTYLNNCTNPYISTIIPTKGHPNRTIQIPPRKNAVPRTFSTWKKKRKVLSSPITNAKPDINKI